MKDKIKFRYSWPVINVYLLALLFFSISSSVFAQPANDNPCGAITLTLNTTTCLSTTNATATATSGIPAPGCASYLGGDVWYKVTVPASGHLLFDCQAGGLTDAGMAIYTATACGGTFTLLDCDDDGGPGLMPRIDKAGLAPGATIYIRVWEYGNNNNSSFYICVYNVLAPTSGDCMGTIPVCNNFYNPALSPSGPGNYLEAPGGRTVAQGCGTWEQNSTWYSFTVETAGTFTFTLNSTVDYDWALYDITYSNCYDILDGTNLPLRCNWSAATGNTGLNTTATNANEAGYDAWGNPTPTFCSAITCTAGQKFVLLVDNYSNTATNYSLTFNPAGSGGTAGIYDNVGPSLGAITPPPCGSATLAFQFSEDIACSSVNASDLSLTGPGGPYTLSNLQGVECGSGAANGRNFEVTVTPALFSSGSFTLSMIGTISDKCNNPTNTTVNLPFTITNVTAAASVTQNLVCNGATNGATTVAPSGGTAPYTYNWNSSPAQNTQTATNLPAGTYTVTVSDLYGCNAVSNATITAPPALNPGSIASSQTICDNTAPAAFTSTVNASGGTGTINYQWQYTTDPGCASGWTDIGGATGPAYSLGALTQTTCYRRKATDNCTSFYTNVITITVNPLPVITSSSHSDVSFCGGSNGTISIIATGAQPLFYSIGGVFVANGGAFSGLPNGVYPISVRDNNSCIATGTTITITDGVAPPSPNAGTNATYCEGDPISDMWATALNGGNITWYNTPGLNPPLASNVNNYTPANTIGTTTYYITETVSGCQSAPATVVITINPTPVATASPSDTTICSGTATGISLTSGTLNTNFSWTATAANVNGASAGSGTYINQTLSTILSNQGSVIYIITPVANSCTGTSINATVYVNPNPTITATANPSVICSCDMANVTFTSDVSGTLFNWTVSQSGVSGAHDGSGASISESICTTGYIQGTAIYAITSSANSCQGNTATASITVNPKPDVTASPMSSSICSGNSTNISLSSNVATATFSWTVVEDHVTGAYPNSGSSIVQTLTDTSTVVGSATYTITPLASGCLGSTVDAIAYVNPIPDITANPTTQTVCTFGVTHIGFSSTVIGTTFSWTAAPESAILGSSDGTGDSIVQALIDTINVQQNVIYTVTPSFSTCPGLPIDVTVTVNPFPVITPAPVPDTICSGQSTNISLSSNVANTSYNWTTASDIQITGAVNGSGSTISQILTNSDSNLPYQSHYYITPTANGCNGFPDTVDAVINPLPVIISVDTTYITYCGGSDGSITINATGNGLGYSITGNNPFSSSNVFTNLMNGNYPIAVINNYACIANGNTQSIDEVGAPPAPVAGHDSTYCKGDAYANLTASPTAGGLIQWYTNSNPQTPIGTGTSFTPIDTVGTITYYVTETTGGCESSATAIIITIKDFPATIPHPAYETFCSGGTTNVNLFSNPSGGTFTWTVSPNGITGDIDGSGNSIQQTLFNNGNILDSAVYSVVASANGCVGLPSIVTIFVNPIPAVTFDLGNFSNACKNDPIFSLLPTAMPTGGIFSGTGVNAGNYNPSSVGTFILTYSFTDTNTCNQLQTDTITVHALPQVTLNPFTDACLNSPDFPLTGGSGIPLGGTGTYSGTGVSNNIFSPTVAGIGTHPIAFTYVDTNNCSSSQSNNLIVISLPDANITIINNISCNGISDGSVLATATGGTPQYSFLWDNPSQSTTAGINGLSPNIWYHVIVSDAHNCKDKDSILLTQPNPLNTSSSHTDPTCNLANGTATVTPNGGTSPYHYSWSNISNYDFNTIDSIPSGTYHVTVTDTHNCSTTATITLTSTPSITATLSVLGISCFGVADGAASVSYIGNYSILWSTGAPTNNVSGLNGGTIISVIITDTNNCFLFLSDTVPNLDPLALQMTSTNAVCLGDAGKIVTQISGGTPPYTHHWNTGSANATLYAFAGIFTDTVKDAHHCITINSDTIFQPDSSLTATLKADSVKCFGDSSGHAFAVAHGGVHPYSYVWSTINDTHYQTGQLANNLLPGGYRVTITDSFYCKKIYSFEIKQPSEIILAYTMIPVSCEEGDDGMIKVHASGGKPPYTYTWFTDPVQFDSIARNLKFGLKEVSVGDRSNCTKIFSINLTNTAIPCLEIPTAFSPNGDGIHDKWVIKNLHLYPNASIEVFNRWGSLIYKAEARDDKKWDGKFEGNDAPNGSYIYIIDLGNGTDPKQGTLTILR